MKVASLVEKNTNRLTELSDGFRTGRLSVREYLNRLDKLFVQRESVVKAFVEEIPDRFERLRRELVELESRYPNPSSRPLLYGIPVGVKDVFHIEGFPTYAGSQLPPEILGGSEAKAVSALKTAGALILGKTVTAEFAYFAPGPTRNPHHLKHTPGGSSSGSAAAVAAGLCPLALGTQTGGSTLRPAAFCGIVGFKPSYGRISTEGIIPVSPSLDHVGFFTVDVEGAMLTASILCEGWAQVTATTRPVFGVPEGPYLERTSEEGLVHFRRTCDRLSDAGFKILSVEMFKDFDEVIERQGKLVAGEAALAHRRWFSAFSEIYREETAKMIREGQTVGSAVLKACRAGRKKLRSEILKIMDSYHLSAFLSPSALGPAPSGLESTGDPVMNIPWTHAGLPAVSLPSGVSENGLPMGLQVVGSWMDDELLLDVARQIARFLE